MTKQILEEAKRIQSRLIEIRRDIHQHPELAFEERRTGALVADVLDELGIEFEKGVGRTGVVGLLRGSKRGRTVALRADMDALPMQERNEAPYRSRYDGKMHACGHDGHTAMILGAAMILSELRHRLRGQVKLIFQPAEETINGAKAMIRAGVMTQPKVNAIFGIHMDSDAPYGHVGLRSGPVMAAVRHFRVTLHGKGGHGARPHCTHDPITAATAICEGFRALRQRVDAFNPLVISVCAVNAGTTYNIIPETAEIRGTVRGFDESMMEQAASEMRAVVKGAAGAHHVRRRLTFPLSAPPVVNDERLMKIAAQSVKALRLRQYERQLTMGGEDFACYLRHAPGAFLRLGTARSEDEPILHNDRFDFDDKVLSSGAALMADIALRPLQPNEPGAGIS